MANSKVSMKLLIDRNARKVLFAEAGKDTVDFLFTILSLPVGTVIRLLTKQQMVGCLANLYESVETLGLDYIQPNQSKDTLLKPKLPICATDVPLLKLDNTTRTSMKRFYRCNSATYNHQVHNYVCDSQGRLCPTCNCSMSTEIAYVAGATTAAQGSSATGERGFVKGVVTYMVMDNLVVKPMSTISGITLLNKFNVKDVGALDEKVIDLDVKTALKLLKEHYTKITELSWKKAEDWSRF